MRCCLALELALKADALGMLFITLSAILWLFTTLYAIGYLEGAPHRSRFFGFFSLCVTATMGIAMAANLFTFFIFYELLTLSTFPLVVHRGTDKAMKGGTIYLAYTLIGGTALLAGIVWLHHLLGHTEFAHAGIAAALGPEYAGQLKIIFLLLIAGVGVKAAIVPLHGWLPQAMVAPAPVSALLHAVAVVKAGAFGIVRIVYEVYGVEFAQSLELLYPLAIFAAVTILWGSFRALFQDDLKKRLAYSTVSQVSYIVLGVALFGPIGTIGGLVHLVHQGIMKITLFFCAGNYAETLGIHKVSEMDGAGRRMPLTTLAFSIGALGMMGAPLTAGAVSKAWLIGWCGGSRHGLGDLGLVDLQPAQRRLLPAHTLAGMVASRADHVAGRTYCPPRLAGNGLAAAAAPAVHRRRNAGRRHARRQRNDSTGLGQADCRTGIYRTRKAMKLREAFLWQPDWIHQRGKFDCGRNPGHGAQRAFPVQTHFSGAGCTGRGSPGRRARCLRQSAAA